MTPDVRSMYGGHRVERCVALAHADGAAQYRLLFASLAPRPVSHAIRVTTSASSVACVRHGYLMEANHGTAVHVP